MFWRSVRSSRFPPVCIALFLLAAFNVQAQETRRAIQASFTADTIVEAQPGKTITWAILVSNDSDSQADLREDFVLPAGWRRISPFALSFSLMAKTSEVRIISVLAPRSANGGLFDIVYSIKNQRDDVLIERIKLTARVLAVHKLELLVTATPDAVIAGERYDVHLRLSNTGNSEAAGEVTVKGIPDYPIRASLSRFLLKPGEIQDLTISVTTPPLLRRKETHVLLIKAAGARETPELSVSQTVAVEVLPRISGETDSFFRIPASLRFIGAKESGRLGSGQVEFSGEGSLNEDNNKKIEFLVRGADLQQSSMFGLRDERRIGYHQKQFDFSIGDQSFSLSPLLRRYGYGRGAELDLHAKRFDFGGFFVKGRWTQSNQRDFGTYLGRSFGHTYELKLNYLRKSGGYYSFNRDLKESLYSLESLWKPGKYLNLDIESAVSRNAISRRLDGAERMEAKGVLFKRVQYALNQAAAGSDFYGYYNDVRSANASVFSPLSRKLAANLSFSSYASNLGRNPEKGNLAVSERSYRPGLQYAFTSRTSFSLDFLHLDRQNLLRRSDDFTEQSVRAAVGQSIGRLQLRTSVEKGRRSAGLTGPTPQVTRYGFEAGYRNGPNRTFNFFARFGDSTYSADPQRDQDLGGGAALRFGRRLLVNLQLSRSEYNPYRAQFQDNVYLPNGELNPNYLNNQQRFFGGRNQESVAGTISYTLPNLHVVSLQGRWWKSNVQAHPENSLSLAYTIPIRMPTASRSGVGRLIGRVFEDAREGKKPLSRVVVSLNDTVAVTNAGGEFIFPSLTPGTYLLRVELKSIGFGRTTAEPMPRKIEIREGANAMLDIRVIEESSIQVRMAAESMEPYEKGLVEVSNGSETLRELTNAQGIVLFSHLRSGKWTVRIYDNNLPAYHYVENPETALDVRPGDHTTVTATIRLRERPIRFIDGGPIPRS